VGDWYTVGVLLGSGVGIGVILAGLLGVSTRGVVVAALIAAAGGAALTLGVGRAEALAAGIAGIIGVVAGAIVVQGALRRGGTRLGVAGFMGVAGLLLMLLSGIPGVGYVLVVAVPLYAARIRNRQPTRFAGLRTLDK
jgi:hypothetical protein